MSKKTEIQVGGKKLTVSNLDKVLYPEAGFTKGQVINYYIRVAPVLLPHLKNRPITLKRYPEGVEGFFFYEKQCPSHRPEWVKTAEVPTFLHRAPAIHRPTSLAFDLDPGAPADILLCCQVSIWLRTIFSGLGMQCLVKTSGSKGLQLFVPLNTPVKYEKTKAFAHALAEQLEREHPDQVVSRMQKTLRKDKVFVDWSQNDEHKTTVNVYSLRAKSQPTISTPITWQELEAALRAGDPGCLVFKSETVLERIEKEGDLFAPVLTLKQRLPALRSVA
jgi:bifunctional non-homologous end joining protein LigD